MDRKTSPASAAWTARKILALELLQSALKAVDPYAAVQHCLSVDGERLTVDERAYNLVSGGRIFVVGGGKAAAPMAAAVEDVLGPRLTAGLVNVKYGHVSPTRIVEVNKAGHPLPDERGLDGTRRIAALLQAATADDLVIFLVSGGGSALLTLPCDDVSLADKQHVTDLLLRCGATINEINAVRKHLSRSKGGGLARLAYPAPVISLILSDVVGNPLDVIASGPTAPDPSTYTDALEVIKKYDLSDQAPTNILEHLRRGQKGEIEETPGPDDGVFGAVNNVLIGSNEIAARAALQAAADRGFNTMLLSTYIQGEAREVAKVFAAVAQEVLHSNSPLPRPACIVAGGETTVVIRGDGRGGRNQELALAAAIEIAGLDDIVIIAAATDGNDGTTDAAGGIVSGATLPRGSELGLDARQFLSDNNSNEFFTRLGDLVVTGPTNTNVNDLTLVMVF